MNKFWLLGKFRNISFFILFCISLLVWFSLCFAPARPRSLCLAVAADALVVHAACVGPLSPHPEMHRSARGAVVPAVLTDSSTSEPQCFSSRPVWGIDHAYGVLRPLSNLYASWGSYRKIKVEKLTTPLYSSTPVH